MTNYVQQLRDRLATLKDRMEHGGPFETAADYNRTYWAIQDTQRRIEVEEQAAR